MRVLLVEDEASVATGVRRAFEAEGYDVDVAGDGRVGLRLLESGRYDGAVLDVMLPGMNGYEVCRTARRSGVRSAIVLLSAKSGEWDIADGFDMGADDYVTKPFSVVELLARMRARMRGDLTDTVLRTGDLRFDITARRCWRGASSVALTGRETDLLAVLFRRMGRVVPKGELLEEVWGADHVGDPNVVEVYIGRLRRKVDPPSGAPTIETIRGVGYRIDGRPEPR